MDLPLVPKPPAPARAVLALAAFVRERLAEVSDTLTPLWNRREGDAPLAGEDRLVTATARQFATVVAGATAPFAPTSYARARLIRQLHASGLLTDTEARHTEIALDEAAFPAAADLAAGVVGDGANDNASDGAGAGPSRERRGARAATGTDGRGASRPMPGPRR